MNDIKPSELVVKVLEQSDDLSTFVCSKDDCMGLDEFIHSEAKQFQKENLGVTHLFLYNNQIVGFATLVMSQIEAKLAPYLFPVKIEIKYYPALLIGRLATHNDYRGRNVGKNICFWCVETANSCLRQ